MTDVETVTSEPDAALYFLCQNRHPLALRTTTTTENGERRALYYEVVCPQCESVGITEVLPLDLEDLAVTDTHYETDRDTEPKHGDHGTCAALVGRGAEGTAPCGYQLTLRRERTVLMADGTDGHGQPGGRETLTWRHTDPMLDHMHTAQLGGPA